MKNKDVVNRLNHNYDTIVKIVMWLHNSSWLFIFITIPCVDSTMMYLIIQTDPIE